MYGAPRGDLSVAELMKTYSNRAEQGPPPDGGLSAAPDVPQIGRPKKAVLEGLYRECTNMHLSEDVLPIDPGRSPPATHTRDVHVVTLVSREMLDAPGSMAMRLEALTEANKFICYAGSEQGWVARVRARGMSEKPDLVSSEWEDAQALAIESFPLNRVSKIDPAPSFYTPNLDSSAGLPNPNRTKREELPCIQRALSRVIAEGSYEVLTQVQLWDVGCFTLKKELHQLDKLAEKARAYYAFPGTTSVAVGGFMSHFTQKVRTFADDPNCTNLVGISFFGGGAQRVLDSIEKATESVAAYYGDDALLVIVMPSGRRYHFLPDVAGMDFNTPEGFKRMWVEHIERHWDGPEEDLLFDSGLNLYNTLLLSCRYLLPGGRVAKYTNFSTTGMTSNTYYQTFVNTVVWHKLLKPLISGMLREHSADADSKEDRIMAEKICQALYGEMKRVGLAWKPGAIPHLYQGRVAGLLGHDLFPDVESKLALAAVPLGRLLASLVNPKQKPNKSGTAMLQAYGRAISLYVAGGYAYPCFRKVLEALHSRVLEMVPTLNEEHRLRLSSMMTSAELDMGEDNTSVHSVYRIVDGVLLVRKPPTKEQVLALRLKPHEGTVKQAVQALLECVEPSRVALGKKPKKQDKPKQHLVNAQAPGLQKRRKHAPAAGNTGRQATSSKEPKPKPRNPSKAPKSKGKPNVRGRVEAGANEKTPSGLRRSKRVREVG